MDGTIVLTHCGFSKHIASRNLIIIRYL